MEHCYVMVPCGGPMFKKKKPLSSRDAYLVNLSKPSTTQKRAVQSAIASRVKSLKEAENQVKKRVRKVLSTEEKAMKKAKAAEAKAKKAEEKAKKAFVRAKKAEGKAVRAQRKRKTKAKREPALASVLRKTFT